MRDDDVTPRLASQHAMARGFHVSFLFLVACRKGNGHIDKKYMSIQFLSTRADLDPIDANKKGGHACV